ncbi:MAG: hypothetical protein GY953_31745, partial [bacterium]|nr:hypothetical protein [bacterium]
MHYFKGFLHILQGEHPYRDGYLYPPAMLGREAHNGITVFFDRAETGFLGFTAAGLTVASWLLLALVLAEIAFGARFWCRSLCPGGAVYNLPDGANMNVILFNHEVLPWQPGVVKATESSKKRLDRWINEMKPSGLTNIHDALEAAFRLILRTTGRPEFDTFFFLTDGKPTAGKVKASER